MSNIIKIIDQDIIFLSYDEPNAEKNYSDLLRKVPWAKRGSLDEVENIPAFTMRAMRNLCLDSIRQQRDEQELAPEIAYIELNPHQQTEQKDLVRRVKILIDNLPELQRTIIRMRDVEGMELSEIAYITTLTENAVTVNLSRARQKIREKIIMEQKRIDQTVYGKS